MHFTINGRAFEAEPDIRASLLDLLRNELGLMGTKKGCDHGQCGACTILVNGRRINACLTLAVMHQDDDIVTIEGLGAPDKLAPLQDAFVRHDAYQCGYCTPGQICSAVGLLSEVEAGWASHVSDDLAAPALSRAEIAERMSGNLCRCSAYPNIVDAIAEVAGVDGASVTEAEVVAA
ncbi:2Fe-2S iron-sulfur cluster-binding protein [Sphingomonas sp. GlSt437]|uniref:2Fe-2S iron-sulfur cluster-binding protein n=1 Tax=Sphingomonas sp. GlSt437 TaxID=3389970 RepID=UPI003A888216